MEEAEVEEEAAAVAAVYRRHHRFSIPQTRRPMLLLPQLQPLRQRPFPLRNSSLLRLAHKHLICLAFLFLSLKEKQRLCTSCKFQSVQYIWLLFVFELADLNTHQMMPMVTIEMQ